VAAVKSPAPAGGEWLLLAEISSRRPVLLVAVAGAEGLSWVGSTTPVVAEGQPGWLVDLVVDEAASWLRRADAAAARREERARRGRLRIHVVRRDEAVVLLRWARFGVLADLRAG
jgi:hypothetical protein